MAEGKNKVMVYRDWIGTFESLTDDEAGKLIKHFFRYVNDLNPEAPDRLTQLLFEPIKQTLKRDLKKYEVICQRNRINGELGGRPVINPNKPTGLLLNPNKPDNDNDSDRDNDIDKDKDNNKKKNIFNKPTIEEVKEYCKERKNDVDPVKWYNFYESKGWMIGKNKMKDWRAGVRTWEKGQKEESFVERKMREIAELNKL